MVFRIINQTIIGKDNPLCAPAAGIQSVNITFLICPPFFLRQEPFIISKPIPADTFSRRIGLKRAAFSAKFLCFLLRDIILRQTAV